MLKYEDGNVVLPADSPVTDDNSNGGLLETKAINEEEGDSDSDNGDSDNGDSGDGDSGDGDSDNGDSGEGEIDYCDDDSDKAENDNNVEDVIGNDDTDENGDSGDDGIGDSGDDRMDDRLIDSKGYQCYITACTVYYCIVLDTDTNSDKVSENIPFVFEGNNILLTLLCV